MTEEEAKTKWCPFARIRDVDGVAGFNRPENETFGHRERIGGENHCLGSACMAWRVKGRIEIRHKRTGQVVPPDAWRVRGDYEEITVPDGGFCGLAGAPR